MARLVFRRSNRSLVAWLILAHRYLGAILGALFVVWFASGIAMIYVRGMPAVTADERLSRLAPLAFDRVLLSPEQAASRSQSGVAADRARLFTILDRPVYRFSGTQTLTVYADTGDVMPPVDDDHALKVAAAFVSADPGRVTLEQRLIIADQWTLGQRRQMPLQKFTVHDDAGTEVYVSEPLGEVVMKTTRRTRALAWLGPIPHWFYFAALRRRDDVWRDVMLWTSAFGCVLALLGLVIGIRQWRAPYVGCLKWHQTTGLIFGVFALTWVFSGWLSMEPAAWASADRALSAAIATQLAGSSGTLRPLRPSNSAGLERFGLSPREIEWVRILDEPYFVARGSAAALLVDSATMEVRHDPFSTEAIVAAVARAAHGMDASRSSLLTRPDSYYYGRDAAFPVLKIVLNDAAHSWVYVDPRTARLVTVVNRRDRVERWLYHGLHSLDFAFWYRARPFWDAGVILLCSGGVALSVLGLVLAAKRASRLLKSS